MTQGQKMARFKHSLLGGAAAFSLVTAVSAQDAEEITSDLTAPVLTSDRGSVTFTDEASITLDDTASADGVALTIDSDATVDQGGSIVLGAVNGATGILLTGDVTFDFTMDGDIDLTDDGNDDLDDDALEVPFDYSDDRYGFRMAAGSYTGAINFDSNSTIDVEGDSSYGIRLEGALDGSFTTAGDLNMIGQDNRGISVEDQITGDFVMDEGSSIFLVGQNSDALYIEGDVDGAVVMGGAITVTAFQDSVPDSEDTGDTTADEEAIAENAFQAGLVSGDAITITSNVGAGVVLDGVLPGEFETEDTSDEATSSSSITVRGSGYALNIDGGTAGSTIGLADTSNVINDADVVEDGFVSDYGDYGVINRGTISAQGLYDGVDASGVRIANTTVAGGIRNDGSIDAGANQGASRALVIAEGGTTPTLVNTGRISATTFRTGADGDVNDAIAISIEAGGSLTSINNINQIEAVNVADTGDAIGIMDASGTLTSVTNSGLISASVRDDAVEGTDIGDPVGTGYAINLAANTTGVDIYNTAISRTSDTVSETARLTSGFVNGDVVTGTGDDIYRANAGGTAGNIWLDDGNDTIDLSQGAFLVGDVDFGTGDNTLNLDDAYLEGDLTLGAGASTFTLANDARFVGSISAVDAVALDISGSEFLLAAETTFNVSSLDVRSQTITEDSVDTLKAGVLGFTVSQTTDATALATAAADGTAIPLVASQITSAGTMTLEDGTEIRTLFSEAFDAASLEQTIISAGTLNVDIDSLVLNQDGSSPFLFQQSIAQDGDEIVLTLNRRTAAELGIGKGLAGSFDPVIAAISQDEELGAAVFNTTSQAEFLEAFNQIVAGPLDAPMAYARAQNNSVTSFISQRVDALRKDEALPRTAWLQEETYFVNRDMDNDSNGFDGGGFVVAFGVDSPVGPVDAVGASVHLASARYDEQLGEDFPFNRLTYGVDFYAAETIGQIDVDARVGYAMASSDSERNIDIEDERRSLTGEWDGTQISANGRVRYRQDMGKYQVSPFVSIDYLSLSEDAYTEEGDDMLALTSYDREAESLRTNVGVAIGKSIELKPSAYDTGIPGTLTPRVTAAWSQELMTDAYEADYQFDGGDRFTLTSDPEGSAAILAGDIDYQNQYAKIHVGVSGIFGETTEIYTLRAGIGLKW